MRGTELLELLSRLAGAGEGSTGEVKHVVPWRIAVAVGQLIRVVLAASRAPAEADGFARRALKVQAAYL